MDISRLIQKKTKTLMFLLILIALMNGYGFAYQSDTILVSAERISQTQDFDIFFRTKINGHWNQAKRLSSTNHPEIHPAIVQQQNGNIMVAWAKFSGVNGTIQTRFYIAKMDVWTEIITLKTLTNSDITPALSLDEKGSIWMAYSGEKEKKNGIYLCSWDGNVWQTPTKITPEGGGPNMQPRFFYDEKGVLLLAWKGFSDGNYKTLYGKYENGEWLPVKRSDLQKSGAKNKSGNQEQRVAEVLHLLQPGSQASISFNKGEQAITVLHSK